ncbi:hypothetical protein ASPNIDRAFT_51461 [Aspergillus niger]|uniref:Ketoreductase domain-containing protein n=1 Tax=Aspergillus niger TaxID=5061 RepID=A0A100ICT2_ASPNG|nr:hypothetical protein ASPNIDRAFT_51461 [Aspergillus niger]
MSPSIAIDNTTPEVAIDHTTPAVSESAQPSVVGRTNDLFSLGNRTIVITGGGRGLGIVLAGAVVEAGGDVVCLDLLPEPSAEEWASVQKLAAARGLKATYIKCDITDEQSTEQVLKQVAADAMSRGMPLRGAVTCAGIQQMVPALEYPVDMWKKMLDVNVIGTFIPAKHCARIFKEQNIPGSIVMIASMSGQIANRGLTCTAYNSSKAAVHQMCRSVAQEWGQYGIRVNTLSAGYIRTAMTDALLQEKPEVEETWMRGALLGRLGVPEDFKAPTVYMLADGSGFMTVPEAASIASTPELQQGEFNPADGAKPSSPFYRHATPSLTIDRLKKAAKATTTRYSPLDPEDPPTVHRQPVECANHRESKLWAQKKRRCGWMQRLSRKQRMAVKATIAVVTVGTMVAIALGITAAVGGAVWKSDTQQVVIGGELKVLSAIAPDTQCVIRANWNCGTNKASWAKDVIKGWARVAKGGGLSFCVHAVITGMALNGWALMIEPFPISREEQLMRKQLVPDVVDAGAWLPE